MPKMYSDRDYLDNNFKSIHDRFDRLETASEARDKRLDDVEGDIQAVRSEVSRFKWMAAGGGVVISGLGMFTGWILKTATLAQNLKWPSL